MKLLYVAFQTGNGSDIIISQQCLLGMTLCIQNTIYALCGLAHEDEEWQTINLAVRGRRKICSKLKATPVVRD